MTALWPALFMLGACCSRTVRLCLKLMTTGLCSKKCWLKPVWVFHANENVDVLERITLEGFKLPSQHERAAQPDPTRFINPMLGEVIYGSGPRLQDYIDGKPDHVSAAFQNRPALKIDLRCVAYACGNVMRAALTVLQE